ncbi:MAG TPA: trypsin-like serine protease [Solirubrobacterales bacterium]|nr:trypsin-like serine protease [Solirubrobacterales bacterium]
MLAALTTPALASGAVSSFEVSEYRQDFGVSAEVAEERLETQQRGTTMVAELKLALGDDYAGVWFDNEKSEFVVPLLPGADRATVASKLAGRGLGEDYRLASAESSWEELEAAQTRIDGKMRPLVREGLVQTYLDSRTNDVVIRQAADAGKEERGEARGVAAAESVDVEVRASGSQQLLLSPQACEFTPSICDAPLRGGVGMWPKGTYPWVPDEAPCSVGFKAVGKTHGNRFVLTAGHCAQVASQWESFPFSQTASGYIGAVEEYVAPPASDYAKIKANGNYWDKPSWPVKVAYWGTNQEQAINYEAYSYIGQYVCHAGANSGASCGTVTALDLTSHQPEGDVHQRTEFQTICSKGGDSGGPVFAGDAALGILTHNNIGVEGENPEYCKEKGYYTEITEAADAMGVTVGTRIGGPPTATTGSATNVGPYQATVGGSAGPNSVETRYRFEYGTIAGYGQSAPIPEGSAGHGTAPVGVNTTLSGLTPVTTYHYRLVATSQAGTAYGADAQFTTPAAPPKATTEGITGIHVEDETGKGTLHGSVNAGGAQTHYRFEWGTVEGNKFDHSAPVPDGDAGKGTSDASVQAGIEGLKGLTEYHYRLRAENEKGTDTGSVKTFTTPDWRPAVSSVENSAPYVKEEAGKVDLSGKVNPKGFATGYRFEWGTQVEYEEGKYNNKIPIPDKSIGSGESDVSVQQTIGVKGSTTYHYRLVAENTEGKTTGADKSFTTPDWKPSVNTGLTTGITDEGATLHAKVNSKGFATTYQFEYGTSGGYGTNVPASPKAIGFAQEDVAVSEALGGLSPDTPYYFRIVATNAEGTTYGPQRSFKKFVRGQTFGIDCLASDDCLRVGEAEGSSEARIEAWNGASWSQEPVPAPELVQWSTLNSVSCASATACVAVGHYERTGTAYSQPFAVRWDGSDWTLMSVPLPAELGGPEVTTLKDVSCSAAGACTAVGFYGAVNSYGEFNYGHPWITRWNGSTWSQQSFASPEVTNNASFSGVSCPAADFCMAVGRWTDQWGSGEQLPLTASWDGSEWTQHETVNPEPESGPPSFADVSCVSADACTAVGRYTAYIEALEDTRWRPLIERWNGLSWDQLSVDTVGEEAELRGVSCRSLSACVAVGANGWEETLVLSWNGSWNEADSEEGELHAASCPDSGECMASGRVKHPEPGFVFQPLSMAVPGPTPPQPPVFDHAIGSHGSGNGQFNSPRGIAVDPEGNVWVVDGLNNRIQKFDPEGEYLDQCGGKGSGNGQLDGPADIAVDPEGNIWVADANNHRMEKFSPECEYLDQFGEAGSGSGQFAALTGVAIDAEGDIWTADFESGRIQKFDPEGEYLDQFGEAGSGNGQLLNVFDLATDATGDIWVADAGNSRLEKFSLEGEYLDQFDPLGTGEFGMAIRPNGDIWVADSEDDRVRSFNPQGEFLTSFGESGSGPAQLHAPTYVAFTSDGNSIWVSDTENDRLQRWNFPGLPSASTGEASAVEETTATLNGTVDPEALATTYQFEYGKTTEYGSLAPASPKATGSGSTAIEVSETIKDLDPGTTYHFRVVATNSEGTVHGDDETFTTREPHWTSAALQDPAQTGFSGTLKFTDYGTGFGSISCEVQADATLQPGDAGTVDEFQAQSCEGEGGPLGEHLPDCEVEESEAQGLPWSLEAQASSIELGKGSFLLTLGGSQCNGSFRHIELRYEELTLTPDKASSISNLAVSDEGTGTINMLDLALEIEGVASGTLEMDEPGVYGIG